MLTEITHVGQRGFDYKLLLSLYRQELSLPSALSYQDWIMPNLEFVNLEYSSNYMTHAGHWQTTTG